MSDFYQSGSVTTLHRLGAGDPARLESELRRHCATRRIGLVLPALYSEFETPAMARIVEELRHADYIQRAVVALAKASRAELENARRFFDDFPFAVSFLWIDSPQMQELLRALDERGLPAGEDGKGRSCWLSYGYLLAAGDCEVIAVHDCDIRNYERNFLARLCYPLVDPVLDFEFAKGYYARVTDRLCGRVTRLFVAPLLRAALHIAPQNRLLQFLHDFRYPLAGEFAMRADLARVHRMPAGWGLEIGTLAEMFRNCPRGRTCQVDLAENYDHKHQPLSAGDPTRGLRRMATDIATTLFGVLAAEGYALRARELRQLQAGYGAAAEDLMRRYAADSLVNGLVYDREAEREAVRTFAVSLGDAAAAYLRRGAGLPSLPTWTRIMESFPDFAQRLLAAGGESEAAVRRQAA